MLYVMGKMLHLGLLVVLLSVLGAYVIFGLITGVYSLEAAVLVGLVANAAGFWLWWNLDQRKTP
jgi:hypothetical protein